MLFSSATVLCEFQLEESRQFSIEIDTNSSAVYVYKRVFVLKTEDDEGVFQQYLSEFEDRKEELLERFTNDALYMVNRASDITNRSMTARDFNVSAYMLQTVTGSSGIIEYKFTWEGFAFVNKGHIKMGDVFEVGLVLLEKNELSIQYPEGYEVVSMEPEPDFMLNQERRLIWVGPKLFATGTPVVALAKVKGFLNDLQMYVLMIGSATGISIFAFFYHKFREKKKRKEILKRTPTAIFEAESEENKIVDLLQTRGGYLRQSMIVEELGFSKSRTSEILSNMEKKGLIERHKKGREKLVVLLKQQKNK